MKASLLTLALTLSSLASAQTTPTLVAGRFFDPDGHIGSVVVLRDSNNLTQLDYSFCTTQPRTACQRGSGVIASSAFTGKVPTKLNQSAVLNLLVDTSTFFNFTCFDYDPEFGQCNGGTAPAVGGLISLSFTKTRVWATVNTFTSKLYRFGVLNQTGTDAQYAFAARLQGTVLGLTISVAGVDPDGNTNYMWTDNNSVIARQKFQAARH